MTERIRAGVAEFAGFDGPELWEAVRVSCLANLDAGLGSMARDQALPEAIPADARELALLTARLDLPLAALLRSYRIGHAMTWRLWLDEVEREDPEAEVSQRDAHRRLRLSVRVRRPPGDVPHRRLHGGARPLHALARAAPDAARSRHPRRRRPAAGDRRSASSTTTSAWSTSGASSPAPTPRSRCERSPASSTPRASWWSRSPARRAGPGSGGFARSSSRSGSDSRGNDARDRRPGVRHRGLSQPRIARRSDAHRVAILSREPAVVRYDDVALESLVAGDEVRSRAFVSRELRGIDGDDPSLATAAADAPRLLRQRPKRLRRGGAARRPRAHRRLSPAYDRGAPRPSGDGAPRRARDRAAADGAE